jgi:hypothetical protein
VNYLFEKFASIETVSRRESMKFWETIVRNIPPKNEENMPDNPGKWITEYYPKSKADRNIFTRLSKISFDDTNSAAEQADGSFDRDMGAGAKRDGRSSLGRARKF